MSMREIKFRAKTLKEGKWIYGFYAHFIDSFRRRETHRIYSGMADSDPEDFFPDFEAVDPATLGEFTGIQDIKGKDIYEGDIVRYRWTDDRFKKNPRYTVGVVSRDEWDAGWSLESFISTYFRGERLEVLGNVHDMPNWKEKKEMKDE